MKTTYPGRSKYNAKRTIIDGIAFPSRLEAEVYAYHRDLEKKGEIEIKQLQAQVVLKMFYGDDPRKAHHVRYKPDMLILNKRGEMVFIEAKGVETQVWRIKKAAWKLSGPARLEIWKGRSQRNGYKVWCHEVIVPPSVNP
jgi:hypothetical protein